MATSFQQGEKVWYQDNDGYSIGTFAGTKKANEFLINTNQGQTMSTSIGRYDQRDADTDFEDMIQISELSEGIILHNLKKRYSSQHIYTYVGPLLVAVNPYQVLPLYSDQTLSQYQKASDRTQNPPHIFSIASDAYTTLRSTSNSNVSIVVSGESGAGKTETTKHIIKFLTHVSSQDKGSNSGIEQQLISVNPILEAFGNAKTTRNDNSSRFGKYVKVTFDDFGAIISSQIEQYLLEKSRVVAQAAAERNYHVFYQLCRGANPTEKQRLSLSNPEDFYYLNQGTTQISTFNDAQDFQNLRKAFQVLEVSDPDQQPIFGTLAAILHLGNIQFAKNNKGQAVPADSNSFQRTADLVGLSDMELQSALCSRSFTSGSARGTNVSIPLNPGQAADSRDALAKAIYQKLFTWLIELINSKFGRISNRFIGVLDIFGFECFESNSFEQLNINYANEKLRNQFNQTMFEFEQQEYIKEGIPWSHVQFQDNKPCVEMIEQKGAGILSMLDEECVLPKGSDKNLKDKMNTKLKSNSYFVNVTKQADSFGIKHYAGVVVYNINKFLEKNKDTINPDLEALMGKNNIPFLANLFQAPPATRGNTKATRTPTVSHQFKEQLASLTQVLGNTKVKYVSCLKPNEEKIARKFVGNFVLNQLRYTGMVETIQLRKSGWPIRRTLPEFVERYQILGNFQGSPRAIAEQIFQQYSIPDQYAFGKSLIFMQDKQLSLLEKHRDVIAKEIERKRREEEERKRREEAERKRREEEERKRREQEERKRREEAERKSREEEERKRREAAQVAATSPSVPPIQITNQHKPVNNLATTTPAPPKSYQPKGTGLARSLPSIAVKPNENGVFNAAQKLTMDLDKNDRDSIIVSIKHLAGMVVSTVDTTKQKAESSTAVKPVFVLRACDDMEIALKAVVRLTKELLAENNQSKSQEIQSQIKTLMSHSITIDKYLNPTRTNTTLPPPQASTFSPTGNSTTTATATPPSFAPVSPRFNPSGTVSAPRPPPPKDPNQVNLVELQNSIKDARIVLTGKTLVQVGTLNVSFGPLAAPLSHSVYLFEDSILLLKRAPSVLGGSSTLYNFRGLISLKNARLILETNHTGTLFHLEGGNMDDFIFSGFNNQETSNWYTKIYNIKKDLQKNQFSKG